MRAIKISVAVLLACLGAAVVPLAHAQTRPAATTRPMVGYLPRNGLVALWSAEGDARDSAGKNHGKLKGGATFAPGKVGRAFKLDGEDDYIDFGTPKALQIAGDQTIAMWINPDRLDKKRFVMGKSWNELKISVTADGVLGYEYGRDGTPRWEGVALTTAPAAWHAITTPPWVKLKAQGRRATVRVGEWTHVAAVRDLKARTLRWYVNGQMVCQGPAPIAAPSISRQPLLIAGHRHNPPRFSGLIDEVMIWRRALSAAEVRGLFTDILGGVPYVTRGKTHDRILLKGGKVLVGTILNDKFSVATFFGEIKLPAPRVVGIVGARGKAEGVRLVLTDGQVVAGTLSAPGIRLKPVSGPAADVLVRDIAECGYRVSKDKPSQVELSGQRVLLRGGDLLVWTGGGEKLQLKTPHGNVDLPLSGLLRVELADPKGAAHRAVFCNGSVLSGTLLPRALAVKLALGPRVTIPSARIVQLITGAKAVAPTGAATILLRNGDRLFGQLTDKALALRTDSGNKSIAPINLVTMKSRPDKAGVFAATTWEGIVLTGRLVGAGVTVRLTPGGPVVKVAGAQILSIDRSSAPPPADMQKKVEAIIARLGAESYSVREAASQALVNMGRTIIPILKPHLKSDDLEIQMRIREILRQLGANERDMRSD